MRSNAASAEIKLAWLTRLRWSTAIAALLTLSARSCTRGTPAARTPSWPRPCDMSRTASVSRSTGRTSSCRR
jgi:hypothetical protein